MTDPKADISDELLTAYLDGELEADERARIDARLDADPDLAGRLAALDAPLADLRVGMERLATLAPRPDVPSPKRISAGPVAAALVLGLALGAGGMALRYDPAPRDTWQDYAAAYHALYRVETLASIPAQTDFSAISPVIEFDLDAFAQASRIQILRAQILGYDDQPIIQMAYLQDGRPFALCVTFGDGTPTPITEGELEGLPVAQWSDGTHHFLLIGGEGAPNVAADAAYFQGLTL